MASCCFINFEFVHGSERKDNAIEDETLQELSGHRLSARINYKADQYIILT